MLRVLEGGHAGLEEFCPFFVFFKTKLAELEGPQDKQAYCAAISSVITPQLTKELEDHMVRPYDYHLRFDMNEYCKLLSQHGACPPPA